MGQVFLRVVSFDGAAADTASTGAYVAGKSLPISPSLQDVGLACGKDEWSGVRTSKKSRRTLNREVEQGVPFTIVIGKTTSSSKTLVAEMAKIALYALTIRKHNHVGNEPCRSTH